MKKLLILLGILALVVSIPLLKNQNLGQQREVEAETLSARTIRSSILASGKLSHQEEVLLSTEIIGKVTELLVEEGDQVRQGQLLLKIDDEALSALMAQQQASARIQEIAIESQKLRIDNLETQWQRKEQLFQRGLIDQDGFELATNELNLARLDLQSRTASLQQARAYLEEAEKNLRKTRVYSPLDGIVTSLDIKVGETAISSTTNVPGSSLMTIANPDSIHTEVNVDEADIANIALGQEAEVVAIAYPNQAMTAIVESIAISAKQATGSQSLSFVVKLRFTDTRGVVLRPGMSCRAEIFTSTSAPVLAVPMQAITVTEDRSSKLTEYTVFKYDDGIARKVSVQVGVSDDEYQEITAGLNAGDQIIVSPDRILRNLQDGDSVSLTSG
ncbi:MAG: efflux RND transporter periplasmic adaptor subunit [Pseudomonadales bacterium]|nr:efflux RND transporter periplasmic adaptor subunit [Pseudomonadales bacterium]